MEEGVTTNVTTEVTEAEAKVAALAIMALMTAAKEVVLETVTAGT